MYCWREKSEALRRLKKIARDQESPLIRSDKVSSVRINDAFLQGTLADITVNGKMYNDLFVSLPGIHQVGNAQVAVVVVDELRTRYGFKKIRTRTVSKGLSNIQHYSGLQGRIDLLSNSPCVIADVAHNPDGMRTLVNALRKLIVGKMVVVFGVMADKEFGEMIRSMKPYIRKMITVTPKTSRALKSPLIIKKAYENGISAIDGGSVDNGIRAARKVLRKGETMLIAGSHYVVGEALTFMKKALGT